jgi:hypothetical protein
MKSALSLTAAAVTLALSLVAVAQSARDAGAPPARDGGPAAQSGISAVRPVARGTFESTLSRGTTLVARWDLPADSTGASFVLAQTRGADGDRKCIVASLVSGAWVTHAAEEPTDIDSPTLCFSAARVANRWVFARWNLGGSGDGARRVNESSVSLVGLVGGQFSEVYTSAVQGYSMLVSNAQLVLDLGRNRRAVLGWSADGRTLVVAPPARRGR